MARNYLTIRSVIRGLRPAWLPELRPRGNRNARQLGFSGPSGDLVFDLHRLPGAPVIRSFWNQVRNHFRSPQTITIELQRRLIGGLHHCVRSSMNSFQPTLLNGGSELAGSRIAPQNRRPNLRFLAPWSGVHEPFPQIADCPLMDGRSLDRRVRNPFARHLPDQGSQINQNHMRRLLPALLSPFERQKRMNQNEENHVNQCIAGRRESDCDCRR